MLAWRFVATFLFLAACSPTVPAAAPRVGATETESFPEPTPEPAGLESDQIIPIVKEHELAFRGCHTMSYGGGPLASGHVVLDWEIKPDGGVGKAWVSDSSFGNTELDQCIIGVMDDLKFPAAPGATDVSYRFRFRAQAKAEDE